MSAPLPPEDPAVDPSVTTPPTPVGDAATRARTAPDDKAPDRTAPAPSGLDRRGRVKPTRASGLWIGVVTAAVLAIAFLVFIAQNSEKVSIKFLGFEGQLSLAIALLLSAVIGALVVAVPGILRITQLRHALRKNARH